MLAALDAHVEGAVRWSKPEGGYFLWLDELPLDADELLARSEAAGVTFVPGADFYPGGDGGGRAARLAFSYASPSEIGEGVSILASFLR
jgi:2-aminoadipate transaminase